MPSLLRQPPLGLYLHVPWCVRKCPYCDFNSHALPVTEGLAVAQPGAIAEAPADDYLRALRVDVAAERRWLDEQGIALPSVTTVFIGGGTPSLLPAATIGAALECLHDAFGIASDAEITLEANPGASDEARFAGYRAAGVNRLSIGVQSFDDGMLEAVGRVHDRDAAERAIGAALAVGFKRLNVDLMYALPGQTPAQALADVRHALDLGARHLSHYQLTLEPNTAFHHDPPPLPPDEQVEEMEDACREALAGAGFERYEVSAFAPAGEASRHNLNYWQFGDYLGLGPGAHGKLTDLAAVDGAGAQWRSAKLRHPRAWLAADGATPPDQHRGNIEPERLPFEFMLNALRLREGVPAGMFGERTGCPDAAVAAPLAEARALGLLEPDHDRLVPTLRGFELLNDLQGLFLP